MCVVIDLDMVCLICLQANKEMYSIFATDVDSSEELQIFKKIAILSELKIDQNNQTLPNKICTKCLQDLKTAWRFRKNCQAAMTIFRTIVRLDNDNVLQEDAAPTELEEQKIKLPKGLQIKRIENPKVVTQIKKAGGPLMRRKLEPIEEFVISNDRDSPILYEQLVSCDNVDAMINELQGLEESGEANDDVEGEEDEDDDENNFVEYYLTDEGLVDEPTTKVDDNKVTSKSTVTTEEKDIGVEEGNGDIAAKSKTSHGKWSSRKENKEQKSVGVKTSHRKNVKQTTLKTQTKPIRKIVEYVASSTEESGKSAQTEVRQVKTRKRKSSSSDTKPPKICEICGNFYRFQHALNAHMRRHYNEKPFPCEFCDKAFVSNVELRRHMRVHTGQKPYACQYCERRFSDFGSRIKHERTHTGERPYHCVTCGKSFAYPHVLSVHLRTHTGEKRFRCDYCSKGFTKKAYLQAHVESHHSDPKDYQVVIEDSADNNIQTETMKSETFEKCVFTTEFVNEEDVLEIDDDECEDEDENQAASEIVVRQPKVDNGDAETEEDEDEIHEIVEVHPDEYTIRVR